MRSHNFQLTKEPEIGHDKSLGILRSALGLLSRSNLRSAFVRSVYWINAAINHAAQLINMDRRHNMPLIFPDRLGIQMRIKSIKRYEIAYVIIMFIEYPERIVRELLSGTRQFRLSANCRLYTIDKSDGRREEALWSNVITLVMYISHVAFSSLTEILQNKRGESRNGRWRVTVACVFDRGKLFRHERGMLYSPQLAVALSVRVRV